MKFNRKKPEKIPMYVYYIIAGIIIIILNMLVVPAVQERSVQKTDYSTFIENVEKGNVTKATVEESYIYYEMKADDTDGTVLCKTVKMDDADLVNRLLDAGVTMDEVLPESPSILMTLLLSYIVPIVIFIFIGRWLSKKMMSSMGGGPGGAMSFGKSNAKVYVKSSTGIKFSDVAGEDEAKELLTEIVDYLHNPQKYTEIGASMPKGALLVGPPGTGKTLLAKAVAGEAEVPFFSISGSEFVEMFVGMGAAKVRDLFKQANEKAPCIVFIDEIDTIGKKRDGAGFTGGNDEREQTLNQLLTEMDGFDGSKGVVILAATNRPDSLDPALLRPGRFDRRIPVELPDLQGREEILKVHAKKIKIADTVRFDDIAKAAAGASGAELANIVNEAALRAVRDGRKFATQADFEESIEVVIAGYQKKNRVLSNKEKLIVSYHEIGHALVAAKQTESAPVHKITIIPRTSGALGYTMQVDDNEHYLMSKEELENKIATFTGGRAAEELIFHSITTGASNDIEQATKIARAMISRYGMSDDFDMVAMENISNQYLGGDSSLACSFETQTLLDKKVVELVKRQHEKALQILQDNIGKLHELAKYLYEHETITGDEFMKILEAPEETPAAVTEE
ncbi:ATP-dependent metallopeptidase FtsH/Yme1/Tma family protein [Ruminococcus sp. AF17-22AC]|jgi:cell division protease FtsH|uniref:ATP-dependent zinc metalloprotease FtsH n=1 Tax=Clostridia TaxID=186801 RepID=UPI0009301996|nr:MULTISPECIES: ATP-dependent zinc metalloprotease FtsH [Clostridia]MCB6544134.1 ATP-dependent zinc metalloprotease FtsH [Blautia glucerasea]RGU34769.1 ATP-dependent metallopeptidase FtsH/Yme1/Tma family protein [Ruminococcus sp. AF17-22AC]RHA49869.1 ATP-dependent metallopeptidase FtsH/Yme1/Tma family protein [Blautia obeum]RHO79596.1 ATP-dependent metallopeptidase FtsH/Yme1/Tma family protein [Ruminococcus sp. AF45-4BH]